jgi:endoglucanase
MTNKALIAAAILSLFMTAIMGAQSWNPPGSFVDKHGQLRLEGTRLVDENGKPVQLKGMSAFWINWASGARYANRDVVETLVDDWGCTVYRLPVGIEPDGAYIQNPVKYQEMVKDMVEACLEEGIYVIVDWHAHDTLGFGKQEADFFKWLAESYGGYPNVIYELWNEPIKQSWSDEIKPYTQKIIDEAIRPIDPDNIILAGSSNWSTDLHLCAADPLNGRNIMYSLHFYAGTHTGWLMGRAEKAMEDGLPVFISEWGTSAADGGSNGDLYLSESRDWIDWMDQYRLSWCNWSVSDKKESSAALLPGANPLGGWSDGEISPSGRFIREMIRK